jgi:hypothetical protein
MVGSDEVAVRDDGRANDSHRLLLLDIEHGPLGPAQARAAVAAWSDGSALGAHCDDLLLIVSELVTNAVLHGAPPVRVEVVTDERTVTVSVVDGARTAPQRRTAGAAAESGRGMLLVDLLSADSGVRPAAQGKAVWACLPR